MLDNRAILIVTVMVGHALQILYVLEVILLYNLVLMIVLVVVMVT